MIKFNELKELEQLKVQLIKNEVSHLALTEHAAWMDTDLFNAMYDQIIIQRGKIFDELIELVNYSLDEFHLLVDYLKSDKALIMSTLEAANTLATDSQTVSHIVDCIESDICDFTDLSKLN